MKFLKYSSFAFVILSAACSNSNSDSSTKDHVIDDSGVSAEYDAKFLRFSNTIDRYSNNSTFGASVSLNDPRQAGLVTGPLANYSRSALLDVKGRQVMGIVEKKYVLQENTKNSAVLASNPAFAKFALGSAIELQMSSIPVWGITCAVSFKAPLFLMDSDQQIGWMHGQAGVMNKGLPENYKNCDLDHMRIEGEKIVAEESSADASANFEVCEGEFANICDLHMAYGVNDQAMLEIKSINIKMK